MLSPAFRRTGLAERLLTQLGLPLAEAARHPAVSTSLMTKAVAQAEQE